MGEISGICSICGGLARPACTCSLCGGLACSGCFAPEMGICIRCADRAGRH